VSSVLSLPILSELTRNSFTYGTSMLVEFEPHSLWYEASITIAAHALKHGIKTDYHSYVRSPDDIRKILSSLGLTPQKLEQEDTLRIIDSYTVTTGIGTPEKPATKSELPYQAQSLRMSDWSIGTARVLKGVGVGEADKRRVHLDDNSSVLTQFNQEKEVLDIWRARFVPFSRILEQATCHSLMVGVHSEAFYKYVESVSDGVIDFKSEEKNGAIEHFVRTRILRGKAYDSRWRRLRLLENGEVQLAE